MAWPGSLVTQGPGFRSLSPRGWAHSLLKYFGSNPRYSHKSLSISGLKLPPVLIISSGVCAFAKASFNRRLLMRIPVFAFASFPPGKTARYVGSGGSDSHVTFCMAILDPSALHQATISLNVAIVSTSSCNDSGCNNFGCGVLACPSGPPRFASVVFCVASAAGRGSPLLLNKPCLLQMLDKPCGVHSEPLELRIPRRLSSVHKAIHCLCNPVSSAIWRIFPTTSDVLLSIVSSVLNIELLFNCFSIHKLVKFRFFPLQASDCLSQFRGE